MSFIEELDWNRRLLYSFTDRRQTETRPLLLVVVVVVVGGGGWTAAKTPVTERASSHHVACSMRGGSRKSSKDLFFFLFLKTVKSKRSGERDRSVMYNMIFTLQLGLHLEPRTSPKRRGDFFISGSSHTIKGQRGRGVVGSPLLWGESRHYSPSTSTKTAFKNYSLLPSQRISV